MPIKSKEDLEKRKKVILDSAIRVLGKREYRDCPVEEIAANAGIGKGTVYLYFKSKEELYGSIMLEIVEELNNIIGQTAGIELNAGDKIRMVFRRTSEYIARHDYLLTAVHEGMKPMRGKLHSKLHEAFAEVKKSLEKIISSGVKNGEFRDCDGRLFSFILFSLLMTAMRYKSQNRKVSKENISGTISDFFIRGIGS